MSVVVTGAAGFIGRHVVDALLRRGIDVLGLDRRPWATMGEQALITDLADPDPRIDAALAAAHGVVHLAGRAGVRDRAPGIAAQRWRDNVVAGERVLDATPPDVMVVVASSSSVYGGAGTRERPRPCREDDPLRPVGGYACSKHVLEQRSARRAARGAAVGVVRPFTVAGEGQRPDMAIATWIAALLAGRPVGLFGGAGRQRDITDVRDVAEGVVRMLERRVTRTINLGTGTCHRLDDLLAAVARQVGVEPVVTVWPAMAEDVATTRADVGRCREHLGFVPVTDLTELISRQIAATAVPSGTTDGTRASSSHYRGAMT